MPIAKGRKKGRKGAWGPPASPPPPPLGLPALHGLPTHASWSWMQCIRPASSSSSSAPAVRARFEAALHLQTPLIKLTARRPPCPVIMPSPFPSPSIPPRQQQQQRRQKACAWGRRRGGTYLLRHRRISHLPLRVPCGCSPGPRLVLLRGVEGSSWIESLLEL